MDWFVTALKRYCVLNGRAGRSEYWWFSLLYAFISFALSFLDHGLGLVGPSGWGPLSVTFFAALFLPAWGVGVRRLHDTDRSGWWLLLNLLPVIGFLVVLFFTVQKGSPGPNRFGDGPAPAL